MYKSHIDPYNYVGNQKPNMLNELRLTPMLAYGIYIRGMPSLVIYSSECVFNIMAGLHYNGQIICITECLYRAMYRTRYLTSQDLDELIVPMKVRSWSDMMAELNEMYPGKNIAAANFRNVWFPTKSPNDSVYGNNSAAVRYNIEPLLKTTCDSYIFPHRDRSKVIRIPTLNN